MAKYNSYKELADAFASGELSSDDYALIIDNDSVRLRPLGPDSDTMKAYNEARELFDGAWGSGGLEECCIALGIPAECA